MKMRMPSQFQLLCMRLVTSMKKDRKSCCNLSFCLGLTNFLSGKSTSNHFQTIVNVVSNPFTSFPSWCYPASSGKRRCSPRCRSSSPSQGACHMWALMGWFPEQTKSPTKDQEFLRHPRWNQSVGKSLGAWPNAVRKWQRLFRGNQSWLTTKAGWYLHKQKRACLFVAMWWWPILIESILRRSHGSHPCPKLPHRD